MANSETRTSTRNTLGEEHQVFLSFRGPDTRRGFTNSLYHALVDVGIRVFIDDEELRPGDRISDNLLRAIDDSKLYIPIFSKNYASSHWCLRELARMVENTSERKEDGKKKVILPIFYDVEPNDVKLETELYSNAILNLEQKMEDQKKKFSFEDIMKWRWALKQVDRIKGWELKKSSGDGELTKLVVREVLDKLETRQRIVTKNLVGMEDHITAIKNLLNIRSDGVQLIGIYGMGGIGKTTLAKIIFNQLCPRFGKNCSFLDDMRETTKTKGLVELQEKLLSDISPPRVDRKIGNIDNGIDMIRETICNKEVLIVLDDVNHDKQIQCLIEGNSLCPGSIILVTTRDKSVLNIKEFKFKGYEMTPLGDEDALKLFYRHAFNDNSPPANYDTLSKGIVSTTGGLPIALEVIGASLNGEENTTIWEERLEMLRETPDEDVLGKLRISYDALNLAQQQIFLDVASLPFFEKKTNQMYVWEACKFFPEHNIQVLTKRCMIKVLNDRLTMHDQLRDLGRTIAKAEGPRLLIEEDIICELRSIKNKRDVRALALQSRGEPVIGVTSEQIEWFPYLRFLWLSNVICQGDFTAGCLSELRWINWHYDYSMPEQAHPRNQCLEATNLRLENAVVVKLSGLDITENAFESLIKGARKLKVLTIQYNKSIHEIPTFPENSVLKELTIYCFWSLMEIDCSIGQLRCLTELKIEFCHELRKLPEQIGELQNLQHLSLKDCHGLIELPDSVLKLVSLIKLDVSGTRITRLPDSIGRLPSLSSVNETSTLIEKLPNTMSKLLLLQTLLLDPCNSIQELPKLPISLTILRLRSASLHTVPNLSYLTNLVELLLSDDCQYRDTSNEFQAGDLGWIWSLTKLSKLHVCFPNVRAPATELGSLLLKELTLYGLDLPTFRQLPPNLIVLELYETRGSQVHLDGLPPSEKETPFLPTSFGKSRENKVSEQLDVQFLDVLESSERSRIQDCRSSESLVCQPKEPGCSGLQAPELIDHWRGAILFPSSQKMLVKFLLSGFLKVQDIQFVTAFESLEEFCVKECFSLKSLGGLSNSKNLKRLEIDQCPSLKVVEGIDELEFLGDLEIINCGSVGRILDPSSSKIPDNCSILITGSGELPDCCGPRGRWRFDRWKSYKEKILNGAKLAWSSEIETADSETGTGDSLQKTNQENKEKKRKRKTESAKQQGRRKRRKLQKKAWVRLFHPIISLCRTRKMNRRRERARQSAKEQKKRKRGKSV